MNDPQCGRPSPTSACSVRSTLASRHQSCDGACREYQAARDGHQPPWLYTPPAHRSCCATRTATALVAARLAGARSSERSSLVPRLAHVARARRCATSRRYLVVVGHDSLRQAPPARASGAGPTAQDGTGRRRTCRVEGTRRRLNARRRKGGRGRGSCANVGRDNAAGWPWTCSSACARSATPSARCWVPSRRRLVSFSAVVCVGLRR